MVKKIYYTEKKKTEYICDRCSAEMNSDTVMVIESYNALTENKRRWHFCSKCYMAFVRGIDKKRRSTYDKR